MSPRGSNRSRSPGLRTKHTHLKLDGTAGSDRGENESSELKRGDNLNMITGNSLDRASSAKSGSGMQNFNEEAF